VQGVLVWDVTAKSQHWAFPEYKGKVSYLGFSPNGDVLVAAYDDGEIGLWSVAEGKALPSPVRDSSSTAEDWPVPPFFGPNSNQLYLNRGRERKALEVWNWSTGSLSIVYQAHFGQLGAFDFSPDGSVLAIGAPTGLIVLLDTKEFRQVSAIPAHATSITCFAFSPSGNWIASGGWDRSTTLWDVKTQAEIQTLCGNDRGVGKIAFTPDEKSQLTLMDDGRINVWDLRAMLERGLLWRTTNRIDAFTLSADERAIAIKDSLGWLRVFDLANGRELHKIQVGEPNSSATGFAIAFSPTNHLVAWTGWNSVGVLDYDSGETTSSPVSRFGWCGPAFLPDGREFAFAGPTNLMMWEVATRKPRPFAATTNLVFGLVFSPNGALLATADEYGFVTLWNGVSGRPITSVLAHPPRAFDVAFSPDGRLLATGGADATAKLWEVLPGGLKLRHTFRGHISTVSAFFTPDGRRVVSRSPADKIFKLWDTRTGLEVGTIYGHGAWANGFAFSRDGNSIYSAAEDGDVRITQIPSLDQLDTPRSEKARLK
jgi:WD40 repeat protein